MEVWFSVDIMGGGDSEIQNPVVVPAEGILVLLHR